MTFALKPPILLQQGMAVVRPEWPQDQLCHAARQLRVVIDYQGTPHLLDQGNTILGMLKGVFLVEFRGVPSRRGSEVLFVLEIIGGVLQARAKGVLLGVSLVGLQPSTVGVHHPKFLFILDQMLMPSQYIHQHQCPFIHPHRTPLQLF